MHTVLYKSLCNNMKSHMTLKKAGHILATHRSHLMNKIGFNPFSNSLTRSHMSHMCMDIVVSCGHVLVNYRNRSHTSTINVNITYLTDNRKQKEVTFLAQRPHLIIHNESSISSSSDVNHKGHICFSYLMFDVVTISHIFGPFIMTSARSIP